MPGDTGDGVAVVDVRGLVHNHGTGVGGVVGVAYVGGDASLVHGEDGVLVQNRRAHVGKLAQLAVSEALDAGGVFDDARVGHQKAGNIRPVFIQLRLRRARHHRARDIAAAARKGAHAAVREGPVKAGDDGVVVLFQFFGKHAVGPFRGKRALLVKAHHAGCVDKIPAQVICQQHAV